MLSEEADSNEVSVHYDYPARSKLPIYLTESGIDYNSFESVYINKGSGTLKALMRISMRFGAQNVLLIDIKDNEVNIIDTIGIDISQLQWDELSLQQILTVNRELRIDYFGIEVLDERFPILSSIKNSISALMFLPFQSSRGSAVFVCGLPVPISNPQEYLEGIFSI